MPPPETRPAQAWHEGPGQGDERAPLIELRQVTKVYGQGTAAMQALGGVDLRIRQGEFVAVMGPSGSGKSTAMNILGCLDTPTTGSYWFKGLEVGGLTRDQRALLRRHYLGFVFQGFNLLSRTTALENVELPLIYRRTPAAERHRSAREALAAVGLTGWERHTPAELSGGQQQRVAIARALVTDPAVVLADEPTGNLDSARGREIMDLLTALNRERGITIVMVTHEPDMAAYAGREVHFRDGLVERRRQPRGGPLMLGNSLLLALREIRRNVLRSILTLLGIVIGVAAVIVMVTLGEGATLAVRQQIASLGSNLLIVRPGQHMGPGMSCRRPRLRHGRRPGPAPRHPRPGLGGPGGHPVHDRGGGQQQLVDLGGGRGQPVPRVPATGRSPPAGASPTASCARARRCASSAPRCARSCSAPRTPSASGCASKKISCEVIGLLEAKGQSSMGSDQDDIVLIPLRTLQRRIAGNQEVRVIYLSVGEGRSPEQAQADTERLLRERRHIVPGEQDNFSVRDMREIANMLAGTTQVLTTLLGAVASVSLLVGGIGIMNIMLVSVTERTREIGVRLAIGAREREVLMQFLVEAVVLSSIGGLLGILLALGASVGLAGVLQVPFVFNGRIVAIAFLFSAAVGVIFGYFPARRAARLDPIEALRHE